MLTSFVNSCGPLALGACVIWCLFLAALLRFFTVNPPDDGR